MSSTMCVCRCISSVACPLCVLAWCPQSLAMLSWVRRFRVASVSMLVLALSLCLALGPVQLCARVREEYAHRPFAPKHGCHLCPNDVGFVSAVV